MVDSVRIADLHRTLRHEVEQHLDSNLGGNAMAIPLGDPIDDGDDSEGAAAAGGDEAVCFEAVTIETPSSGKVLLKALDLTVRLGENVVICGPNGSGKSSLFRCIWGIWECSKGRIAVNVQREGPHRTEQRQWKGQRLSIRGKEQYSR